MLASRHFLLLPVFVWLCALSASAQDSREWTDKGGKKLTGTFIELTEEENVKIKGSDGKEYVIPLSVFVDEDQQYVKQMGSNESKPAPAPKGDLEDDRLWTDFRGQALTAHYVRMQDGYVVLMRGNKGQPVSFYVLSQKDQDWLRKQLSLRGEANKIISREEMERKNPTVHQELDEYMSKVRAAAGNSTSNPSENSGRPPAYTPPAGDPYVPPSNSSESSANDNDGGSGFQSPGGGQPTSMQPEGGDLAANLPVGEESPEGGSPGGNMGNSGFPSRFSSNPAQDVPAGHCPGCRQELPVGYGPGDHCPRCNFYLEDWVQPGTGAPLVAWYQSSTLWYTVGGAALVLGFLALSAKRFNG